MCCLLLSFCGFTVKLVERKGFILKQFLNIWSYRVSPSKPHFAHLMYIFLIHSFSFIRYRKSKTILRRLFFSMFIGFLSYDQTSNRQTNTEITTLYIYCMTRQEKWKNHKITIHLNLSNIKIKESNYLLKIPPKVRLWSA